MAANHTHRRTLVSALLALAGLCPAWAGAQTGDPSGASESDPPAGLQWGLLAGIGYFRFHNPLYGELEPDPPGNLGEQRIEYWIEPWLTYENDFAGGRLFGKAAWAVDDTWMLDNPPPPSGRDSAFDDLYLGWRNGSEKSLRFEIAGGRYSYQIARALLISDGYAEGGGRGAFWSAPRAAWVPGSRMRFEYESQTLEVFYLERDERPQNDTDTRIGGANYEWRPGHGRLTLGGSFLALKANQLAPQRNGAEVWNLRAYWETLDQTRGLFAEWVREDNGEALDAGAWYLEGYYSWPQAPWQPTLSARYAWFEGNNPATAANEAFDPLFPGFEDWGTWPQGEIAGEYFQSNSNLKTVMLRLELQPTESLSPGLLFVDASLEQPGSYYGGVTSNDLGWELDAFVDWEIDDHYTLSVVLAWADPGEAVYQASGQDDPLNYLMIYLDISY